MVKKENGLSKIKITYNNIEFDSQEECDFYFYLEEIQTSGYIDSFNYHPEPFKLSEPVTYKWISFNKNEKVENVSTLLRQHIYTHDFQINWNTKAKGIFYYNLEDNVKLDKIPFIAQKDISLVEIKPAFDVNASIRTFVINQKWVMKDYNKYINKIIPTGNTKCLFAKTFVPELARYTKKKHQLKKFKYPVHTLEEFINGSN